MKNEENKPLDPMKKWFTEAGIDTPGDEFHLSVLKKIEALPQSDRVYQPVISSLGWKLIFGFISSIFVWSIFFVPAQADSNSLFDRLPDLKLPTINGRFFEFTVPAADFSPHLLLGLGTFFIMGSLLIFGTLRSRQAEL